MRSPQRHRCAGHNGCGAAVLAEHMRALPAHVVNCCGAGDCLVAGFLMRIMEGGSAVDALAHGLARCPALASCGLPWIGSLWKLSAAVLRKFASRAVCVSYLVPSASGMLGLLYVPWQLPLLSMHLQCRGCCDIQANTWMSA